MMNKNTKSRTIKVDTDTHKELSIYKAQNDLKTLAEAVKDLLEKVRRFNSVEGKSD